MTATRNDVLFVDLTSCALTESNNLLKKSKIFAVANPFSFGIFKGPILVLMLSVNKYIMLLFVINILSLIKCYFLN